MFENDYIMRQIEGLSRALANMLLQKNTTMDENAIVNEQAIISQENLLKYRLKKLILQQKINKAKIFCLKPLKKSLV